MFGIGTQELLIILLVVLVLFGSKRIPEIARSLGAGMQSFRRVVRDAQREIDTELLREPPATERRSRERAATRPSGATPERPSGDGEAQGTGTDGGDQR